MSITVSGSGIDAVGPCRVVCRRHRRRAGVLRRARGQRQAERQHDAAQQAQIPSVQSPAESSTAAIDQPRLARRLQPVRGHQRHVRAHAEPADMEGQVGVARAQQADRRDGVGDERFLARPDAAIRRAAMAALVVAVDVKPRAVSGGASSAAMWPPWLDRPCSSSTTPRGGPAGWASCRVRKVPSAARMPPGSRAGATIAGPRPVTSGPQPAGHRAPSPRRPHARRCAANDSMRASSPAHAAAHSPASYRNPRASPRVMSAASVADLRPASAGVTPEACLRHDAAGWPPRVTLPACCSHDAGGAGAGD